MNKKGQSAETVNEQTTEAQVTNESHSNGNTFVACCISSNYKQVETEKEITMSNSKSVVSPVATLKDEFGGVC